jgi:hypothetical protein
MWRTLVDVEDGSVAVHGSRERRPFAETGVRVEPAERRLPRALAERDVQEIRGEHVGKPVLTEPDELTWSTELQVSLGKLEAAACGGNCCKPL